MVLFSSPLLSQIRVVLGQQRFNVTDHNSKTFGVAKYVFPKQFSVFNPTLHDIGNPWTHTLSVSAGISESTISSLVLNRRVCFAQFLSNWRNRTGAVRSGPHSSAPSASQTRTRRSLTTSAALSAAGGTCMRVSDDVITAPFARDASNTGLKKKPCKHPLLSTHSNAWLLQHHHELTLTDPPSSVRIC